jgi:gliding motility-associated-like protein
MKYLYIFLFSLLISGAAFSQITVDETLTTQQLIEDVLINNSPCAEVSNFIASTGTNFGDVNGIAAFDGNGTSFPFESGIILSSGNVTNAPGPNFTTHSDGGFGWPGDTDLEANTNATNTNNASFIQFDFIPAVDEISFNFIMASEEYNENFECTFTDAFAFILTDNVTGTVQNLAVLPGTNTPIEVTNIRYEVLGPFGCAAVNEEYFQQYNFQPIENPAAPSIPAASSPIDFNGQTVPLTAMGSVIQGNDYTIKLVVADQGDSAFDISVYLEAGSFNLGSVNLGDDISVTDPEAPCEGGSILLDTMVDPTEATFVWFLDGVEIVGETEPSLLATEEGLYTVEVTFDQGTGCTAVVTDDIFVAFVDLPNFDLGEDQQSCFIDPITLDATPNNYPPAVISYQWFLDGTAIPGETNPTFDVTNPGFYEVEVTVTDCTERQGITFENSDDIEIELGTDVAGCFITPEVLDATPANYDVMDASFQWFLDGTVIPGETTATLEATGAGLYEVIVSVGACETTDSITLSLTNDIEIELGEDFQSCFINPVTLDATPSNYDVTDATFEWRLDGTVIPTETSATLDAITAGLYEVIVTVGSCEATDSITISPINFTVDLGDDFETCFEAASTITATVSDFDLMDATFQWFLNGAEIANETMASLSISEEGFYTVIATVGECTATDEVEVSEREDITVTIVEEDFKICPEEISILTATTDEEDVTYQWFKNGESITGETNATLEFVLTSDDTGLQNFSVVITIGNCTAEDTIDIELYDVGNCAISQGISPNGDGFNDALDLEFLSDRAGGINSFQVFNRHGLLVFEKASYINEWFGQTNDGEELPTGNYYVIMNFNTEDPVYGNQYASWIYLNRDAN